MARSEASAAPFYRGGRPGGSWRRWAVALDVGRNSFDDADDEPFDPTEFIEEDDEL